MPPQVRPSHINSAPYPTRGYHLVGRKSLVHHLTPFVTKSFSVREQVVEHSEYSSQHLHVVTYVCALSQASPNEHLLTGESLVIHPPMRAFLRTTSESANIYVLAFAALEFYEKAWGKEWPRHEGTILKTELRPASGIPFHEDAMELDNDSAEEAYADEPNEFKYTCLDGVDIIASMLLSSMDIGNALVERPEYRSLCKMLESFGRRGLVVTGHPGIGSYDNSCLHGDL